MQSVSRKGPPNTAYNPPVATGTVARVATSKGRKRRRKEDAGVAADATSVPSAFGGTPSKSRKRKVDEGPFATSTLSTSKGTPSGIASERTKLLFEEPGTKFTSPTFVGPAVKPGMKLDYQPIIKPWLTTPESPPPPVYKLKRRPSSSLSFMEKETQTFKPKPFKVCDVKRSRRVGIAAKTLEDLRAKIRERFPNLDKGFNVVLEDDCTQIENEEYFQTLPKNSVVIALNSDQAVTDVTLPGSSHGGAGYVEVDGGSGVSDQSEEHLTQVAQRIAKNPSVLAFLPKADLQVVTDADIPVLQVKLMESKEYTIFIQEACERRLIDQIKSDEAQDLLKLYHRAKTESGPPETPKKRRAKRK